MRTIADIASELAGIKTSLAKRQSAGGGAQSSIDLEAKMAMQVARGITNLPAIDTKGAELLFDAIATAGIAEANLEMLTKAVDDKLDLALDSVEANAKADTNTQKLLNPESWMTESLYQLANDPKKSFDMKLQGGVDFLSTCGVTHPSEKTSGVWLAFFVCLHFTAGLPKYSMLFNYLKDFKAMLGQQKFPFPRICNYPKTPEGLPNAVYNHIFSDDAPPMQVSVPRLRDIANNHIPLRRNSKLLLRDDEPHRPIRAEASVGFDRRMLQSPQVRRGLTSASGSRNNMECKTEVDDVLHTDHASGCGVEAPKPQWASELIEALRGVSLPTLQASSSGYRKAVSSLEMTEDRPAWANELLQDLRGVGGVAKAEPIVEETHSPTMNRLAARLRPRGNLSLRHTDTTATNTVKPEPIDDLNATKAEPDDTAVDATGIIDGHARLSTEAYEAAASDALKSVKARRADEAAERKRIQTEADKLKKANKQAELDKLANDRAADKAAQAAARDAKKAGRTAIKRPASASSSTKSGRPTSGGTSALKRPAASVVVYTKQKPPKCPKIADEGSIEYNGGKIYLGKFAFRVIRKLRDYYSERQFSHRLDRSTAWKSSLMAIDQYRIDEKKKAHG
jgi:hypothetical protein